MSQFKSEQEFHAARRMFIVFGDGDVLVATKGDVRTHFEWLACLFSSDTAHDMIRLYTRGYVLGNRLVVYKGEDFSHWVSHSAVIHALDLFDRMTEGGITEVGVGAVYEKGVQPWPPKVVHDAKQYYTNVLKMTEERMRKKNGQEGTKA